MKDLEGFPVIVKVPVAWGEMDSFGHVNNVVYFTYFEAARIVLLDKVGWMQNREVNGHGPIVHSTACRFRRPVVYPDTLLVGARVKDRSEDRVTVEHVIVSEKQNAVVAEGHVVVVNFDYRNGVKAVFSAEMAKALQNL